MGKRVDLSKKKLLIDSDAFVSLANKVDNGYEWAVEVKEYLAGTDCLIYLTSFSYSEVLTVASQKLGRFIAVELAREMDNGEYVLVEVDKKLRLKGKDWFGKQRSKNVSFTDCVNMALMKELGIELVFSRDKHYKKNGFVRLGVDG